MVERVVEDDEAAETVSQDEKWQIRLPFPNSGEKSIQVLPVLVPAA
jgi:hypothetical protein